MSRRLLERDSELAELAAAVAEATAGAGAVVLVYGEAGIGKSSLVGAVQDMLPPTGRLLVGACDDLATPRTLGPFRDLAGSVGPRLATALRDSADRDLVLDALHGELSSAARPTVLAVEDVHWADDATLDGLSYLVRRVVDISAVLVLTYRDNDLDIGHPLHRVLGQAARTERVRRLPLARLSEAAVWRMAAAGRLDPRDVHAVTGGNPFFVGEVLASGDTSGVPRTIVEAVLPRVRRLAPEAQGALAQLAVVPSAVERWLLDALLPDGLSAVSAAEQRGLLDVAPDRVAFHHELIRRAVVDSLPVARLVGLNERVLAALVGRKGSDLSRIVHHAALAGDIEAIVRYGPDAAADATQAGAHREAAAHLRLVLQHRDRFGPAARAKLLRGYAIECNTIADVDTAIAVLQEAVDLRRALGDPRELGADLRWLSRLCWVAGQTDRTEGSADEAVAVLTAAGDDQLLALALANKSQLHMLAHRNRDSVAVGERAVALARAAGDRTVLSQALNTVGVARWYLGEVTRGKAMLEESLRMALADGAVEEACRAYANLTFQLALEQHHDEARAHLAAAMELAERNEYLGYLYHFYARRAFLRLAVGDWDGAIADAEVSLNAHPPTRPQTRCTALTLLGRIHLRRGLPGGDRLLSQAWDFAEQFRELQHRSPVAAARAESAWLRGDVAAIPALVEPVHATACRLGAITMRVELDYWLVRAGVPVTPVASDHPYALQARGQWREAAAAWREAGCPYEHAAALAESRDPDDLLAALGTLDALRAEPLARRVRRRLRELGVSRIPRGPLTSTRENPGGLTERQLEVATLLGAGLTNQEIAARLVLSVRTVENHVAAVLDKLGVRNRHDVAGRVARET